MSRWSRRECVALGAAAAVGACASPAAETPPMAEGRLDSLNAIARTKGMRFGTAVGAGGVNSNEFDDPRYRELMQRDCGVLVAENEHKWPYLQPAIDRWTFERADEMVAWGEANSIPFRGHNLVWNHPRWLPAYINEYDFGANPRAEAERIVREHVATICQHYGTRIQSWDVINETVDNTTGELRDTALTRAAGHEINDLIFHVARETAPHAQLVYNDYMTWERHSAAHRTGVLRALEQWLGRGVPIHALGIQAHIGANGRRATEFDTRQEREWRQFLDEATGMGLDLVITEFDVNDNALPADMPARDAAVAAYARDYLDITFSYRQLKDVLCWGLVDHYSWLQNFSARPDGEPLRCTPYDADFQPKPLRAAIAEAFRAAPER